MRSVGSLLLVFGLWLLLILGCQAPSTSTNSSSPTKKSVVIDKSDAKQKGRAQLIRELQQKGIFGKVEARRDSPDRMSVDATVKPRFFTLDFETKQQFVSVIYAYYCDGNESDAVFLRDSMTDKLVGTYSSLSGGLSLD